MTNRYEKVPGAGVNPDQSYHENMCCLMLLRGIRHGRFHLAANLRGAGTFGDVALRLHDEDGPSKTMLMHLSDGDKVDGVIQRSALLSISPDDNDLCLLKHFLSFRDDIVQSFRSGRGHEIFGEPLENCALVLYTDARLEEQPVGSDCQQDILNSVPEGFVWSIVEDRDIDLFNCVHHLTRYLVLLEQIQSQSDVVEDLSFLLIEEVSNFLVEHDTELNVNLWKMANRLMDNPTLQELSRQIKLISDLGDLQEYHSFLRRVLVCSSQALEDELITTIRQELSSTLGISAEHSGIIFRSLKEKIQKWWREDEGVYLTETSPLWDETVHEMLRLMSEDTLRMVHSLDIRFSDGEIRRLKSRMDESRVVLCVVEGECTTLSTCKVIQTLERDRCRFVVGQNDASLHYWFSPWCPTLVIEFLETDSTVVSTICSVIEHCPDKRLVMVVSRSDLVNIEGLRTMSVEIQDCTDLGSLDQATQQQVLSQEVTFQGHNLVLETLINGRGHLKGAVTAEFLLEFLRGEARCVGSPLGNPHPCYVPRTLQRADLVHPDLILGLFHCEGRVFAITGVCQEDLEQLVPSGETVQQLDGHLDPTCRFYLVDNASDVAPLKETQFMYLSKEEYAFQVRVWGGGMWFGRFLDSSMQSTVYPQSVWDLPDRVVIISGKPGIGKSTLLSHVARNTKREDPSTWVILVNLTTMTRYLETSSVVQLLAVAAGVAETFEVSLLRDAVEETGKVAVLLDGFDEVSPRYRERTLTILVLLLKTRISKIWISSCRKPKLEETLSTIAFDLVEFSPSDQRHFLDETWTERVPQMDRTRLDTSITEVLRITDDSLRVYDAVGAPLKTMLVAEVFEQFLHGDQMDTRLDRKMNIVDLYQGFFDQKCLGPPPRVDDDHLRRIATEVHNSKKREIEERHTSAALFLYVSDLEGLSDDYLKDGVSEWGPIGIIQSETSFLHRTITEFFVAKWLLKHYHHHLTFVQDRLFSDDYCIVRMMFNMMLAESFPLHVAVLNADVRTLKETLDASEVNCADNGGRTLLHLAVIADWRNARIAGEVLHLLLRHGADVHATDYVMMWSPIQYADFVGNFRALGMILHKTQGFTELVYLKERMREGLIAACRYGYLELLHLLLEQGVDVCSRLDEYRRTALHLAVEHTHLDVVRYLLQSHVDVNAEDLSGATALHLVAESGDVAIAQCLIQAGANVDVKDWTSSSALHIGAAGGHVGVVERLLDAGANTTDEDFNGYVALDLAYANGHGDIVRLLKNEEFVESGIIEDTPLDGGDSDSLEGLTAMFNLTPVGAEPLNGPTDGDGDLETQTDTGDIPEEDLTETCLENTGTVPECLDIAPKTEDPPDDGTGREEDDDTTVDTVSTGSSYHDVASLEEEEDAADVIPERVLSSVPDLTFTNSTEEDSGTRKRLSSSSGSDTIRTPFDEPINLSTSSGSSLVDPTDTDGVKDATPLFKSVEQGHLSAVKFFLKSGIDVDSLDGKDRTPLHLAAMHGHLDIVQLLVDNRCTLDAMDKQQKTPLYYAIGRGRLDIARFLIEEGHTVYCTDKDQKTPLHCAVINHNLEIVKLLIEEGSRVNAVDCNQDTCLHYAAIHGHSDILQLLIKEGSWVDALNKDNRSPLHYAAMQGHLENVRILIENGSAVDALDKDEDTPLHDAARQGYLHIVELLVENGSQINVLNKDKQTPLQYASMEGHMDVYHYLAKKSRTLKTSSVSSVHDAIQQQVNLLGLLAVNVDVTDKGSPLHVAATEGHLDVVKALLDKESEVDALDRDRRTPLHCAVIEGHVDIVKFLIESGSPVGALDKDTRTPLHYAAAEGRFEIAKVLIEEGSSVNAVDKDKTTPLHRAAMEGHLDIVELLVKKGSTVDPIDKDCMTPLHFAASEDRLPVVRFLIGKGSLVDAQSKELITPLHYATSCGNLDMIHFLIESGSMLNVTDEDKKTPLHYAVVNNDVDIVQALIRNGCAVEALDSDNDTPLHYAAMMGYYDIVKLLIDNGSAVDVVNNDNDMALNYAARQGHFEIVKLLVEMGSSMVGRDESPLHDAASNGHIKIVHYLVDNGSDVSAVNKSRSTPLHYACMQGHVDIVRLLVDKGSGLNALDENHDTPLHYAAMQGGLESVRLLVHSGSRVDYLDKDSRTPMDIAVDNRFEDIVEFLERNGVTVAQCRDVRKKRWCCNVLCFRN